MVHTVSENELKKLKMWLNRRYYEIEQKYKYEVKYLSTNQVQEVMCKHITKEEERFLHPPYYECGHINKSDPIAGYL